MLNRGNVSDDWSNTWHKEWPPSLPLHSPPLPSAPNTHNLNSFPNILVQFFMLPNQKATLCTLHLQLNQKWIFPLLSYMSKSSLSLSCRLPIVLQHFFQQVFYYITYFRMNAKTVEALLCLSLCSMACFQTWVLFLVILLPESILRC